MIADDLSRIAMSPSLGGALARAGELARRQGHLEVTLEHMLLALCEDPDAGLVLAASNIDSARLKSDVSGYLATLPKRGVPGQTSEPGVSPDLRRILEAAAAAARGGRRREINGAIVLAAIVGDGRSPAAHLLQAQGLTFEGAIRALQSSAAGAARSTSANTEDILANARERVQSRTGQAARKADATRAAQEQAAAEAAEPEPEAAADYDDMAAAAVETAEAEEAPEVMAAPEAAEAEQVPPEPAPLPIEPAQTTMPPRPAMPAPPPAPPPIPAGGPPPVWAPPPSRRLPPTSDNARLGASPPPMPPPIPQAGSGGEARPHGVGGGEAPFPSGSWPGEPRRREGIGAAYSAPRPYNPYTSGQMARAGPVPAPTVARPVPAPRAELGQLVENIPRTMRVAVPALVEVRVAKAEVQALADGLQGGGAAYHHEVTITKAMSVRLRAPDGGFFIETASPETQWIERAMLLSGDDFASWRWHVTPREKGKKRLQLVISARTVGADGLTAETALPDQVITVRVRTNYAKVASHFIGWGVAAVIGGLLAKFGENAIDAGMQVVAKLTAG